MAMMLLRRPFGYSIVRLYSTSPRRKQAEIFDDYQSPRSVWPLVMATVLSGLGAGPDKMKDMVTAITEIYPKQEDQIEVIRRTREAIFKSSVLIGFPRGINGLSYLKASTPENVLSILARDAPRTYGDMPPDVDRGLKFFSSIYSIHTESILKNMGASHPLLGTYAIHHLYAPLFSDLTVLSAPETSIVEVVCCLVGKVEGQAKGHIHGARNLGVSNSKFKQIKDLTYDVLEEQGEMGTIKEIERWKWLSKFQPLD